MSNYIKCEAPGCEKVCANRAGYVSHLRGHRNSGDITQREYEVLKDGEKERERLIVDEKDVRRWKADIRRWKRIAKQHQKGLDLADRVADIVRDSLEARKKIKKPKISVSGKHLQDEVMVLLLSDTHVGKKTDSYNHNVFAERMDNLMRGVLSITQIHRNVRPMKKIVVVLNGDIIDAESIYPSQSVSGISATILDQVYTYGLPVFVQLFEFLLETFEEVEVHAVRGNHGKLNASKWSSAKSTNWDLIFYKSLEVALRDQDRIGWNIYDGEDEWKAMFKIFDYGFLATHGDMIRMYYNTPSYGIARQSTRWQATYRDEMFLHYFLFSHFHTLILHERFNQVVYTVNGSFVTDDQYAEENMGVGSVAEQALFAVHPEWGRTWSYPLKLENGVD